MASLLLLTFTGKPHTLNKVPALSGLEAAWEKGRVAVLLVGSAFAAVLSHFFVIGLFP